MIRSLISLMQIHVYLNVRNAESNENIAWTALYVDRSRSVSNDVFLGLFRDSTSDPWQWTDSNVTSSIDRYWISDPMTGSETCASLQYLGVYQESCTSPRSYMCKTEAVGTSQGIVSLQQRQRFASTSNAFECISRYLMQACPFYDFARSCSLRSE